jgi:hypothetical protein
VVAQYVPSFSRQSPMPPAAPRNHENGPMVRGGSAGILPALPFGVGRPATAGKMAALHFQSGDRGTNTGRR